MVSESERICIDDALGSRYIPFQKKSLFSWSPDLPEYIASGQHHRFTVTLSDCLTIENQADVYAAGLSLDTETRRCVADVFIGARSAALDMFERGDRAYDVMECLTQEQAASLGDLKALTWCVNKELRNAEGGDAVLERLRLGEGPTSSTQAEMLSRIGQACALAIVAGLASSG